MDGAKDSKEPLALKFMSVIASISATYELPYTSLNTDLLVKKFIGGADNEVGINFNVFYKGGKDAVLGCEIQAFALDQADASSYNQYSYKAFNDSVLEYLRGRQTSGRIFEDHGQAGRTATDGKGWDTHSWTGTGEGNYLAGPPTTNPVAKVCTMNMIKFRQGSGLKKTEEQQVVDNFHRAQTAMWKGKWEAATATGLFDLSFAFNYWKKVFGVVSNENYSTAQFGRPTNWTTLTAGGIDSNVPKVMPVEIKSNQKTITNANPGDALTGGFGPDTKNQGSWEDIPAVRDAFNEAAKEPKERLKPEWFNGIRVAYPSLASDKKLPFTVDLPTGITENMPDAEGTQISGNNRPVVLPNDTDVVFGEKVFNRFYLGYYMLTMHYMMMPNHSKGIGGDGPKPYSNEDIWQWVCFRTACYLNQLWTQYDHDLYIASLYASIVLLYQIEPDVLKQLEEDDLTALFDDIEEAADDSAKATAEDLPDELVPASNKDQRERLYKQCALLLNMHKHQIKERNNRYSGPWHTYAPGGGGAYNHRLHIIEAGDTTSMSAPLYQSNNFINRLLSPNYKQIKPFLDMPNWMAAGLVPTIRLYKVFREKDKLTEVEFAFPTAPGVLRQEKGITGLFDSQFDRGDGVGLKEFSWEYDGETPATASKYIKAKLTLFFQTFTDFTAVRGCGDRKYRFVDLFASPACAKQRRGIAKPHGLQYDPEYYRIKIEVGYHWDPAMHVPYDKKDQLKNALFFLRQVFSLVLVDNEININEDGTVNISASYRAYIEEAVDSFKFNALNTMKVRKQREAFKEQWEAATALGADGKPTCGEREINIIRDKMNARMRQLTKIQHRAVMETLLKRGKIHYLDFSPEHIEHFRASGHWKHIPEFSIGSDMTGGTPGPGETFQQWLDKQKGTDPETYSDPAPDQIRGDYRVYYFYLSDLVYFVTSNLYESGELGTSDRDWLPGADNTRVLLTDFQYYNSVPEPGTPPESPSESLRVMNMADIPISVEFFTRWYIENVVRMEVEQMPIGSFIRRLLVELITEAMGEVCISDRPEHHVLFSMATLLAGGVQHGGISYDPISYMLMNEQYIPVDTNEDGAPDTSEPSIRNRLNMAAVYNPDAVAGTPGSFPLSPIPTPADSGVANQWNYILLYSTFRNPAHPGTGNRDTDAKNGCYHLDIGRDAGIVKKVSFSKNNIKYHRESRMMNQGSAGLSMLSAVYDCSIDMIGNTLFLPGQEFWLNPYGFGGEAFGKPQHPALSSVAPSPDPCTMNGNSPITPAQAPGQGTGGAVVTPTTTTSGAAGGSQANPPTDGDMCYINSYANVMGIGGYQLVTKVSCKIVPGQYTTNVKAKFIYSGLPPSQGQQERQMAQGTQNIQSVDYTGDPQHCDNVIRTLEVYERKGASE